MWQEKISRTVLGIHLHTEQFHDSLTLRLVVGEMIFLAISMQVHSESCREDDTSRCLSSSVLAGTKESSMCERNGQDALLDMVHTAIPRVHIQDYFDDLAQRVEHR